jgi:hypothetical protein
MGVNIPVDIPEKSQSTTLAKQIQVRQQCN